MTFSLVEESRPAKTVLSGSGDFTVSSGKHLRVETSPGGEEIFDAVVPEGKTWSVVMSINIVET